MLMLRHTRDGLKLLIVRPRQPVSGKASARNALVKMVTFKKFIDTPNSMTVIEDFVPATYQLIKQNAQGVFNVANPGVMTPYHAAELLKEYINPNMEFVKITKEELNKMTFAERIDSVLDMSKLEAAGIKLKPIEERLRELLPELKKDLDAHPEILNLTQLETTAKLSIRSNQ
jgi:UDP-glucose 4,6-dehydratase